MNATYSTPSCVSVRPARRSSATHAFVGLEAEHAFEVGDRDEQRPVGVALAQQRVDLEYRMGGVARVDARAVVDDPLEDRQRPESHATMLADAAR